MRENLATLLEDFRRFDREIAVVRYQGNRRRVTTYGEIARLAGRFGALLEDCGVGPSDRVLLWGENSAEWVAAFYGCMLRGALVVPLDAMGSAEFAAQVAMDVRPKLAVGDAVLLEKLRVMGQGAGRDRGAGVRGQRQGIRGQGSGVSGPAAASGVLVRTDDNGFGWDGARGSRDADLPLVAFEEWGTSLPQRQAAAVDGLGHETPLQILFTSGTTGEPKGVVHTHGNVLASIGPIVEAARGYKRYERLVHPVRILHTLPLSHVFGQTMGMWIPPIFAMEVHFESRLVASRLVETIKRERISVLAAVPRVMAVLKSHLEMSRPGLAERVAGARATWPLKRWWRFRDVHRALGPKFWALISGGGALAGELEQFWNAMGFVVVQGYGMTETMALITLNHPFHVASGTIGKPLPGREVKLGADGEVLVRGPMISGATWSRGELRRREDEWLATGDLAETESTGELRFKGRKSEVIVTSAGVNVHPEDLEAALEEQPGVRACAVVPVETANGPEPCAVLAMRGVEKDAAEAVGRANGRLAEFQRMVRWEAWPEPDLPRTSTGKVRRSVVAQWAAGRHGTLNGANGFGSNGAGSNGAGSNGAGSNGAGSNGTSANGGSRTAAGPAGGDWLQRLVVEIAGETPGGVGDGMQLAEDLHVDSLGRVQLAAALEEKMGAPLPEGAVDQARTVGDLRRIAGLPAKGDGAAAASRLTSFPGEQSDKSAGVKDGANNGLHARKEATGLEAPWKAAKAEGTEEDGTKALRFIYPRWPWWGPVQALRTVYQEMIARPLTWLLAKPRVMRPDGVDAGEPVLIVCNHVTAYDGPLVLYALPGRMRRRVAAAMLGEMLEDFRHFRDPDRRAGQGGFLWWGPLAYWLVTMLYNVFPLPRRRDFQRSFAHAGEALDRGYNVLIFPEGTRSVGGLLAPFRPGIGLLVKQSHTAVLPVAILGLGELKARGSGWFRSGSIEIRVGEPIRFRPEEGETAITARLHAEVEGLMKTQDAEKGGQIVEMTRSTPSYREPTRQ